MHLKLKLLYTRYLHKSSVIFYLGSNSWNLSYTLMHCKLPHCRNSSHAAQQWVCAT